MSPRRPTAPLSFAAFACLVALASIACDRKPEELPEWRPEDHDHQTEQGTAQQAPATPPPEAPRPQKPPMAMFQKFGIDETILAAWKTNCVPCHGLIGRGDGPQGAIMRPRNLADPAWQRVALDDEIARTIKSGRGRMPAFPQLPDETVAGLVRFVRLMNPERQADAPAAPETAPSAAPSPHGAGSAAPPGAVAPGPKAPPAPAAHP